MSTQPGGGSSKYCRARTILTWAASACALLLANDVRAASIFSAINFSSSTAVHFANSIGLAVDHRAYEAATGLGANGMGFDIGLDVSLTKLNDDFTQAMSDLGAGSSFSLPMFPAARLNVHKSTSRKVDIGVSWMSMAATSSLPFSLSLLGFDLKWVVWEPEESPTWALRLSYSQGTFGVPLASQSVSVPVYGTVSGSANLTVTTVSWTPQLLVSRKLDWAEGYIGVGYHIPTATVKVDLSFSPPADSQNQTASESGAGGAFEAFTGVSMRLPLIGLRLTMEGWYSAVGAPGVGVKLGSSF